MPRACQVLTSTNDSIDQVGAKPNDSSDMLPPIAIRAVAADTPLGDLEAVWRAWVRGDGPRGVAGPSADCWKGRTERVAGAMLRRVEDRGATGLILATTKGDIE